MGEPPDWEYGDLPDAILFSINTKPIDGDPNDAWIPEMTHFLSRGLPPDHLATYVRKQLAVLSHNFCLFTNTMYHEAADGIWRRAVGQFKKDVVLWEAQHGIVGGHNPGDTIARKISESGHWWPTTKNDAHDFCKPCDLYQRMGQPDARDCMPHQPILTSEPFQKWGLNFVSPFKLPATKTGNKYILVTTNY